MDTMDDSMIQEAKALLAAMARLTALAELLQPDSAEAIAAAKLSRAADYLQIVHDDFVRLTTVREQAVGAAEIRHQQSLEQCAARVADAQKVQADAEELQARARERLASLDARETAVQTCCTELDARQADLDASLAAHTEKVQADAEGLRASTQQRLEALGARETAVQTRCTELDARQKKLDAQQAKLDASLAAHAEKVRADAEQLQASTQKRLAALDAREMAVDARRTKLDAQQAKLYTSLAAQAEKLQASTREKLAVLGVRETAVDARRTKLDADQAKLAASLAAIDEQVADSFRTCAERASKLDAREAALVDRAADLEKREAELAERLAHLRRSEADLVESQEALEDERSEIVDERASIQTARDVVTKDVSALEDLKKRFEQTQQDAADRVLAADTQLKQRIDDLCVRLAACSTEVMQPHIAASVKSNAALAETVAKAASGLTDRLGKVEGSLARLEQRTSSPADLDKVREAVIAVVERIESTRLGSGASVPGNASASRKRCLEGASAADEAAQGQDSVPGHAPLASGKRRREASPPAKQSEWQRLVAAVADTMTAMSPEQDGNVSANMIFYELSVMALRPSFKTGWDALIASGAPGVWHCVQVAFDFGEGAVSADGRCERHGRDPCLRVMLRRQGGVVRTLFSTPESG